jgi:hypothetical protein
MTAPTIKAPMSNRSVAGGAALFRIVTSGENGIGSVLGFPGNNRDLKKSLDFPLTPLTREIPFASIFVLLRRDESADRRSAPVSGHPETNPGPWPPRECGIRGGGNECSA